MTDAIALLGGVGLILGSVYLYRHAEDRVTQRSGRAGGRASGLDLGNGSRFSAGVMRGLSLLSAVLGIFVIVAITLGIVLGA